LGRVPESEAMYDCDMDFVNQKLKRKNPDAFRQHQLNIRLMKRWQREGK